MKKIKLFLKENKDCFVVIIISCILGFLFLLWAIPQTEKRNFDSSIVSGEVSNKTVSYNPLTYRIYLSKEFVKKNGDKYIAKRFFYVSEETYKQYEIGDYCDTNDFDFSVGFFLD